MNCERCNTEHNGEYGSGRFCSRKCARIRSYSSIVKKEEVYKRVSQTLLTKNAEKRKLEGTVLKKDRPKIKKERVLTSQLAEYPYNEYRLYVVLHKKECRRVACLYKSDSDRLSMAYAKYLMSVKLRRILNKEEQVDHIDNNSLNDDVDNLQILSKKENIKKYHDANPMKISELVCPICHNVFYCRKSQVDYVFRHRNYLCCSRKCGQEHRKITNNNKKDKN